MSVIKNYRWLSKDQIESIAHKLRQDMESTNNAPRWPEVADCAANFLRLDILWTSISDDNGMPVFARICPTERLIELNEDISMLHENFGLFQSTLGHEIGHWLLHINQEEAQGVTQQTELVFDESFERKPFLCRSTNDGDSPNVQLSRQQQSVEWQAQYFSSCLLMPSYKLLEVKEGRKLTDRRHLSAMAQDLGVSISNLNHRLKDLGWIRTTAGSKQLYLGQNAPRSIR